MRLHRSASENRYFPEIQYIVNDVFERICVRLPFAQAQTEAHLLTVESGLGRVQIHHDVIGF